MIRMVASSNAGHAKSYFSDALLKSDYYINDQELQGKMNGLLAARLGIDGLATKDTFFALCENLHPKTQTPLTPRTKEERIVGYDINFHCPKSVSIVHALSKDDHILQAFNVSVHETMLDIEADSLTRVRKSGKQEDRQTGELAWADFVHQTSRPVDDHVPDPHLHSHCFVFNMTWDDTEKEIKAAKFRDIKRDMPYYQARFHKRLSDKMMELGYNVQVTDKSFEIEGVPQQVIDLFSKRTNEIGQIAKEKGITGAKELDALGARSRSKKQKGLGMEDLKTDWRRQIRTLDNFDQSDAAAKTIRFAQQKKVNPLKPRQCLDHAISHCFERASVMPNRRLLETAYRYSLGNRSLSLDGITKSFDQDERMVHVKLGSRQFCTTRRVLAQEKHMVGLAQMGKGCMSPLYTIAPDLPLDGQQAAAVKHILTTPDRVSIIRGAAGTGKTTLMKEAVRQIEKAGKTVTVLAPTAQAARSVLKEEGFDKAETVAKFLTDRLMQEQLNNEVLWVDEAGLLGTKDMMHLLEIATQRNARVILGGDTRQHNAVVRGDALRILNTVGKIPSAEVAKIYRQKDAAYRTAVEDLSKGDIKAGFAKLAQMGSIKEIDPLKPNDELVNDYVQAIKDKKTALVISPTHKQADEVTTEIRHKLRQSGLIGKKEIEVTKLVNLNMTEAEKADRRNYSEGQIVQFSQNVNRFGRGSRWMVQAVEKTNTLLVNDAGVVQPLPADKSRHFDVFEPKQMSIAKGDKVKITRNGVDEKDNRLSNGQTMEVHSISKKGNIVLKNSLSKTRYELDQNYGHLAHAHCITSYAAQGKTVDNVYISQPAGTFGATDAKQFYVSVSRGRETVSIYTDDKAGLLDHAAELGDRQSAIELVENKTNHQNYIEWLQHSELDPKEYHKEQVKQKVSKGTLIDHDYEPGF